MEPNVSVPVKSAWASKINWGSGIALLAAGFTFFGADLDAETQAQLSTGILGAQSLYTIVMRTWFTKSVTPSAAG